MLGVQVDREIEYCLVYPTDESSLSCFVFGKIRSQHTILSLVAQSLQLGLEL
jgi:hypothetical protein